MKLLFLPFALLCIAFASVDTFSRSDTTTCEEIYIELLHAVEAEYINGQQADDIYKRCLTANK
jgi:hypothetical protein